MTTVGATVCTAGDRGYFPGVVALFNSLGVVGFEGAVVVLDLGFSNDQRARLARVAQLVPLPLAPSDGRFATSAAAKAHLAELGLTGVIIWIDSDIIVTSPLDDLVREASAGRVCVVRDDGPQDIERGFSEWSDLFGLPRRVQLRTYVNAGFFAFSTEVWPDLLRLFTEACARIPRDRVAAGPSETNPFWASDQDALNAVLMSEVPPKSLHHLHPSEMVHSRRMSNALVRDPARLNVTYEGREARLLHSSWVPKPWVPRAWILLDSNAYVRLLPRLYFGADVLLPLKRSDVPPWLWPGSTGLILRAGVKGLRTLRIGVGALARKLPSGARGRAFVLRDRLDEWLGLR